MCRTDNKYSDRDFDRKYLSGTDAQVPCQPSTASRVSLCGTGGAGHAAAGQVGTKRSRCGTGATSPHAQVPWHFLSKKTVEVARGVTWPRCGTGGRWCLEQACRFDYTSRATALAYERRRAGHSRARHPRARVAERAGILHVHVKVWVEQALAPLADHRVAGLVAAAAAVARPFHLACVLDAATLVRTAAPRARAVASRRLAMPRLGAPDAHGFAATRHHRSGGARYRLVANWTLRHLRVQHLATNVGLLGNRFRYIYGSPLWTGFQGPSRGAWTGQHGAPVRTGGV